MFHANVVKMTDGLILLLFSGHIGSRVLIRYVIIILFLTGS